MWRSIWFLFGAIVGSFLNVCIYRLPREQSIVRPGSRCPGCSTPIAWYDNVPLLSYLLLGGRCRGCRAGISWRYPTVELLTAVMTVAVLDRFGMAPLGFVYLALVDGLIVASFVDLEFQIIPDEISLGGLVLGLVLSPLVPQLHGTSSPWLALWRSVVGALVGGGLLYATGAFGNVMLYGLRRLGVRLRRHPSWRAKLAKYRHMREAMGMGDVKLLAMAGSLLGWQLVTFTFFIAPVLAVVPGLIVLALRRSNVIPYGPFLALGLLVAVFAGHRIIELSGLGDTIQLLWSYYGGGHGPAP